MIRPLALLAALLLAPGLVPAPADAGSRGDRLRPTDPGAVLYAPVRPRTRFDAGYGRIPRNASRPGVVAVPRARIRYDLGNLGVARERLRCRTRSQVFRPSARLATGKSFSPPRLTCGY